MNRHIIYNHTLKNNTKDQTLINSINYQTFTKKENVHKEYVSNSVGDTQNMSNPVHISGFVSDMAVVLFIVTCLYLFVKPRITQMAITGSEKSVWKSLSVFIIAIPLSIFLSGVTLGAVVSRHVLKRHITVDWYSVILGSIFMVIISRVYILNYLVIIPLSIITLAAIMYGYIAKSNDFL